MCEPTTAAVIGLGIASAGYGAYESRKARKNVEGGPKQISYAPDREKEPMKFRDDKDRQRQRGLGIRRLTIPLGQTESGGKTGVNVPN